MRILLVAPANSSWTVNLIQYFLLPQKAEVFLYPFYGEIDDFFLDFYKKNNIHILARKIKENKKKIPFVWLFSLKKYVKDYGIDVINLQYVQLEYLFPVSLMKKSNQRLVLSYWGSDLLRIPKWKLKISSMFLHKVDSITFESGNLEEAFVERYSNKCAGIRHICRFGIPILNEIALSEQKVSKENLRNKFGIKSEKVVAIGYNALPEQQHLKVIEQIDLLPTELKQKICILLQVNYNISSKEYVKEVEETAKKTGCEVLAIHSYMNFAQIAEIRRITDIFINSQTTDALAGSVCEVLYAGGILVHGEWLNYSEFKEYDIQYVPYWEFNELADLLSNVLKADYEIDREKNRAIIEEMRGWDSCGKEWTKWLLGEK